MRFPCLKKRQDVCRGSFYPSENHIMENIIYNELKTRGYNVDVGIVDVNDTDKNGRHRKRRFDTGKP